MTRASVTRIAVALAAALLPTRAGAQATRTCYVVVDSTGGTASQIDVGGGNVRWFAGGGIWARCRGQDTRWYSDSIAWFQDFDRFDMVGRVNFRDSTAQLTADRASYFLRDERLDAFGNARLRNRVTGSVLRGPTIRYDRRVTGVRDTTLLVATGRPTIEYRSEEDLASAEPYVIVADRVTLRGNSAARAWGHVTIDRTDFHGLADSATLDTRVGTGRLMSAAQVTGSDSSGYTLTGRDIDYRLEVRKLVWVQAQGDGRATSAEWTVVADTLQFDIRNDRIQRGTAWGDSLRPEAASITNTIHADSLAIEAPDQILEEVRGVGTAVATSRETPLDSAVDWVAGDTVIARFAGTDRAARGLSEIRAMGGARARYRVFPPENREGPPDISYSRGDRIVAHFAHDRLSRVDIAGRTDGVYLEAPRKNR
jgi:hypothetical protein